MKELNKDNLSKKIENITKTLIVGLIFFIPLGQMIKIPLISISEKIISVLFFELIIFLIILLWVIKKLIIRNKPIFPQTTINKPIFYFVIIAVLTFIIGIIKLNLSFTQILTGSMYFFRWVCYMLIFFVIIELFKNNEYKTKIFRYLLLSSLIVAFLGLLQYFILPNMKEILSIFEYLKIYPSDPHKSRLVSSFLDPNLLAGYLIIFLSLFAVYYSNLSKVNKNKRYLIGAIFFITTTLVLTFSRSGYLVLLALLFFLLFKRLTKSFIVILIILVITAPLYYQGIAKRIIHSVEPAGEVVNNDIETDENFSPKIDKSGMARLKNWRDAWEIIKRNPLTGVGYNNYFYATRRYNLFPNFGSDSSLLFIFATTGIFGFLTFIFIIGKIFVKAKEVFRKTEKLVPKTLSLSMLIFIPLLFIHSIFTNSLFYPQIMITFWILTALLFSEDVYNTF